MTWLALLLIIGLFVLCLHMRAMIGYLKEDVTDAFDRIRDLEETNQRRMGL